MARDAVFCWSLMSQDSPVPVPVPVV